MFRGTRRDSCDACIEQVHSNHALPDHLAVHAGDFLASFGGDQTLMADCRVIGINAAQGVVVRPKNTWGMPINLTINQKPTALLIVFS